MKFDLLIKGGTLVTGSAKFTADIGIIGEKIAAVATGLPKKSSDKVIDATGKLVMPGAIDVHNHFQLPFCGSVSADGFGNGTKSAAMGGVTTVLDFAIQNPASTVMKAIEDRKAEADPKVYIDYGLHAGITNWNEERRKEIPEIIEAGLPSFKMFMIYKSEGWQSTDGDLFAALRETSRFGGMIGVHAESNDIIELLIAEAVERGELGCPSHAVTRPDYTESEAIVRAIQIAEATGGHLYIFHMSTAKATQAVIAARRRGVNVHAETGPQYLLLTDEVFDRPDGHHFATCPPVRKVGDQKKLWEALQEEHVEVAATDTCTFNSEQKATWGGNFTKIPFGMPGVETLLPLMYTKGVGGGYFDLTQLVRIVSENPAKIFGMFPEKGSLIVGTDADITIIDPELKLTITSDVMQSNCDYSPFEGTELVGLPVHTMVRGQMVMEDRVFVGKPGYGKFLVRKRLD